MPALAAVPPRPVFPQVRRAVAGRVGALAPRHLQRHGACARASGHAMAPAPKAHRAPFAGAAHRPSSRSCTRSSVKASSCRPCTPTLCWQRSTCTAAGSLHPYDPARLGLVPRRELTPLARIPTLPGLFPPCTQFEQRPQFLRSTSANSEERDAASNEFARMYIEHIAAVFYDLPEGRPRVKGQVNFRREFGAWAWNFRRAILGGVWGGLLGGAWGGRGVLGWAWGGAWGEGQAVHWF